MHITGYLVRGTQWLKTGDMKMTSLRDYIDENFNSVYQAAKLNGINETQLRRWLKADAVVVDDQIYKPCKNGLLTQKKGDTND